MPRVFLRVHGIVQGVGYRAAAKHIADMHRIKGFVRNAPDGSVEILADADDTILGLFVKELRIDDGNIQVFKIDVDNDAVRKFKGKDYDGFSIENGGD